MQVALSKEQITSFHQYGYLAVPKITTAEEVGFIRSLYDNLFDNRAGWEKGEFFDFAGEDNEGKMASLPQLLEPSKHAPGLKKTIFRINAQEIAKQLLGPTAELVFEHAILKPARTGGETPWHQDEAFYPKFTNYRSITFWMPLQPVDIKNGCLDFIPASHKGPLLTHRSINNNPKIHGLEAIGADASLRVACPLDEGDATIHAYRTLHHAGPNLTGEPRRAYALGFGVRSTAYTLRADFPWNVEKATARMQRADDVQSTGQRYMQRLKNTIKSVVR